MKKYLITGIGGFVGRYFWEYLLEHEQDFSVTGLDVMHEAPWEHPAFSYFPINMMAPGAVNTIVSMCQPDYVVHFASISSVGQSWGAPAECFTNNTAIFLHLAEAVRKYCPSARVLSIGSSEEYGNYPPEAMPLREDYALKPCNPYAVARVAQEMLSKLYVDSYGLNIMMTRSFNHIGPRQRDVFVIPSFVKQLVEIKKNGGEGIMRVGNIDIVRDFLDVRDVVDAYWRILTQGKPGEVYNVCSGKGVKLRDIINITSELLEIKPIIKVDSAMVRPTDNKIIIGNSNKVYEFFQWTPMVTLTDSLLEIINFASKN